MRKMLIFKNQRLGTDCFGPVRNFEYSKNKQLIVRVHSSRNATQLLQGSPKFLLALIFSWNSAVGWING